MKKCIKCNKESSGNYCVYCGEKLVEEVRVKEEKNIAEERTKEVEKNNTLINDNKALYIIVFALLAIIIGLSIYTVNVNSKIDNLESQVSKLKSEKSRLSKENTDYSFENIKLKDKADFLDENIVFVLDGYGNYYYTYDQVQKVTQGEEYTYWAYNIEAAKYKGYKAWKK